MSDMSVRVKGYLEQLKDYSTQKKDQLKEVPRNVWLKNIPAILFILTFMGYLMFASKGHSLIWGIVFILGLAYSIFLIHYWKKDRDFNIHLSIVLLLMSLPLASFEVFSYLFSILFKNLL